VFQVRKGASSSYCPKVSCAQDGAGESAATKTIMATNRECPFLIFF
jgi:hypothetical protein